MKRFGWLLIIAGMIVIGIPVAGRIYTAYQQRELDRALEEQMAFLEPEDHYARLDEVFSEDNAQGTPPEAAGTGQQAAGSAADSAGDPGNRAEGDSAVPGTSGAAADAPAPEKKPVKPAVSQTVLGRINIEKIKVDSVIVEGVEKDNLKVGIGHIPGTSAIGEVGNCALAGHRSYTFGRFFNRLDELEIGDEISVTTKKGTYSYKIYDKKVVLPEDVSVLKRSKTHKVLTLITCEPIFVATHRLIIHARIEEDGLSKTGEDGVGKVEKSAEQTGEKGGLQTGEKGG